MDTILGLIAIIGMLTMIFGVAVGLTEFFSMRELRTHLHDWGVNVYSTEKEIQNNLRKFNIGKVIQLLGAQVIFTSEYKCRFSSRFSFTDPLLVKGEIIWSGGNAKIVARMPLGYIIILIGSILPFGSVPFFSLFGLSSTTISNTVLFIPFIIILGLSFIYYFLFKKKALSIINSIIELVQPKNI